MVDVTSRLRLVVDSTGFDKAGRSLKNLQRGVRDAETSAMRLQRAFQGVASVIGVAFSTQAFAGFVRSFNEQARAFAKVEQAVRSTGAAAGFTAAELSKLSTKLQGVTLFGDDQILNEVTAQLLTFTNIAQDEFLRTQKVALDLATVLDGDLKSASIQLGKALNDPVANLSALSRSGIQFSASQKEIIKNLAETGRLAEAQRVILTEIERQYGGQAEAAAKVGSGVLTQLKNLFGDVQEVLGERLVKAISGPAEALRDFLSVAENQQKVADVLVAIGAALTALVAPAIVSGISGLAGALLALTGPIGLTAAAIGGLVLFRDDIAKWAFGVRDAGAVVQASFEALQAVVKSVFAEIAAAIRQFSETVLGRELIQRVTLVVTNIIELFKLLLSGIADTFAALEFQLNKKTIDRLTKQYEGLIELQATLNAELRKAQASPEADLLAGLGSDFERGSDAIKAQLDEVNTSLAKTSEELNNLLNPGHTFDNLANAFEGIADRAKEIADAKLADPFEDANNAGQKLLKTTQQISAEADKAAEKFRRDVALTAVNIQIGERLGAFDDLDLRRLNQSQRDAALFDFERIIGELESVIDHSADLSKEDRLKYISDLASENARFLEKYNAANDEHVEYMRDAIAGATQHLLDDLIFNGGRGFKDFFRSFGRDVVNDNLLRPISDAIAGRGGLTENLTKAFENFTGKFQKIGQTIFGKGAAGSAAGAALGGAAAGLGGFQIGKALSGLLGITGNKKSIQAGGAGGAGIGFLVGGPIGAAIGAALGAILGGLLSKPSNKFARGLFDPNTGASSLLAQKDQSKEANQNAQSRNDLFSVLSQGFAVIAEITGATFAQKLALEVNSRDGIKVGFGGFTSKGGPLNERIFKDPEQAIQFAVQQLVASLQGGDAALVNLAKSLANTNIGLDGLASVIATVGSIAKANQPPISKYGEALKELDKALAGVANSAQARAQAVSILKTAFESDIERAIEEIEEPAVAAFRELARNLATVLNDATALGVDIGPNSRVMELIGLQISEFFNQAAEGGADIVALSQKLSELGTILQELGIDASVAAQALQGAVAAQRAAFDQQIQDDIGKFLTGPLDQLEKLLADQKKRLEQAEALGADLAQVERLSALELRQFFQGLSDSALQEVQDFLGLFNEAADSVARQLDLSRQDLRAKADQFEQFAQQFSGLATDLRERFIAASPRESLDILRGRASELLGQIGQGNESAAQALPQVLNQLVENARQSFGNTKQFQEVLDFALSTLGQAEQSAIGVKTEAERQIAALDESNDLLGEIRDILQSTQAFNALLNSYSNGGVASAGELLALIQSGAGLTPNAANDNAATLSVTGLIAQSIAPIISPLVASIDGFTQNLAQMPYLQRLQIDATDRVRMAVEDQTQRLEDKLDRLEVLSKQQLAELEAA